MSDESLRELERQYLLSKDPQLFEQLYRAQLRAQTGDLFELSENLSGMQNFEMPILKKYSFRCASQIPRRHRDLDTVLELNEFVEDDMPAGYTPPENWDKGLTIVDKTHGFGDALTGWTQVKLPISGPLDFEAYSAKIRDLFDEVKDFKSLEEVLWYHLSWSVNNQSYKVKSRDGETKYIFWSDDKFEQKQMQALDKVHKANRQRLVKAFLSHLKDPFQFYMACHVLPNKAAYLLNYNGHYDLLFIIVDEHHIRALWMIHDRWYF